MIAKLGRRLADLEAELKALSERLDEARAIIAEVKLSGLPDALEGDQYRQAITWGAMGGVI